MNFPNLIFKLCYKIVDIKQNIFYQTLTKQLCLASYTLNDINCSNHEQKHIIKQTTNYVGNFIRK